MKKILIPLLVLALSATAQNLILNSSFEINHNDSNVPMPWHFEPGRAKATCELYTKDARSGSACLKITNPSTKQPHVFGALTQLSARLSANQPYTISFYIKAKNHGYIWFGGGKTWQHRGVVNKTTPDAWTRVSYTFTPTKEDLPFVFRINIDDKTDGVLIDDVQIEMGTKATPYVFAKPLKPGEAEATFKPLQFSENLITNPSFETLSAVRPQDWIWDKRNTNSTFEIINDTDFGERAIRIRNNTGFAPHVYCWFGHLGDVPVKPNTIYSISIMARTHDNNVAWFGGGHGWKVRKHIPSTDGKWQAIRHTFTTGPEDTSFPFMIVSERIAKQLDIDEIVFVEGRLPDMDWKPSDTCNFIDAQAVIPAPYFHRSTAIATSWDQANYPLDTTIFSAGELKFNAFVSLLHKPENATLRVTLMDQNNHVLATSSHPLPNETKNQNYAWNIDLNIAPKTSPMTPVSLKLDVVQGDKTLATRTRPFNIFNSAILNKRLQQLIAKRKQLANLIDALPALPTPSRIRLSLLLLDRFLDYAQNDIKNSLLSRALFTLNKLDILANDAIKDAQDIQAGKKQLPPGIPTYLTSDISIEKSAFKATVKLPDGSIKQNHPVLFTGYGHFLQVRKDIELFPSYGINMIQIEIGPNSFIKAEGKIDTGAIQPLKDILARAEKANVAVNLLLSPHYFPKWALDKYPHLNDCQGGFLKYCVHAPEARAVIEQYLRTLIPAIKDSKALHSFCITNEPVSINVNKCAHIKRNWEAWLKQRFETIKALNDTWKTDFASFKDVPPLTPAGFLTKSPLAYEFTQFNQVEFAEFHTWLASITRELAPHIPVHSKIMMSHHFNKTAAGIGSVSPYLFSQFSQINGNDHYSTKTRHPIWYNTWTRYLMGYDYQRSTKDIPVFNSENHIIPDRNFEDISPDHTYSSFFQGAIHGQSATTTWVWERTNSPVSDLAGSILHRPLHCLELSQAAMDLMRLAQEVTTLQQRPPKVAILWSKATRFYEVQSQTSAVEAIWRALTFLDQAPTILGERQLELLDELPPHLAQLETIILPNLVNIPVKALKMLEKLQAKGVKLIVMGTAPTKDEYNRPLVTTLSPFKTLPMPPLEDNDQLMTSLAKLLADVKLPVAAELIDAQGKHVFGAEVRSVIHNGKRLVSICNQAKYPITATLRINGAPAESFDLISLENKPANLTLQPLKPLILQVK